MIIIKKGNKIYWKSDELRTNVLVDEDGIHARWFDLRYDYDNRCYWHSCSFCFNESEDTGHDDICPKCGAKMNIGE